MKKILLSGILLALTASVALAGGLNITYGVGCWPENPLAMRAFACNTNSGSETITTSFVLSRPIPDFAGISGIIDGHTNIGVPLPAWWQMYNTGSCRAASLSVDAGFLAAPMTFCVDPWNNLAQGGIGAYQTSLYPPPPPLNVPAPERFRLKVAYVLVDAETLWDHVEYYGWHTYVNHAKTVGSGACAGCATPLTMVLEEIVALSASGYKEAIYAPIANNCLNWQQGGPPCFATPAKNPTWGQVKSLYR